MESDFWSNQGETIIKQVDEKILQEFLLEVEKLLNKQSQKKFKIDNVGYSNVYNDANTGKASIMIDFSRLNADGAVDFSFNDNFVLNAVGACKFSKDDETYASEITKLWRAVLKKHFGKELKKYSKQNLVNEASKRTVITHSK